MSKTSKRLVILSMAVAALVGIASIADMAVGIPFARQFMLDGMLLVGSGLVIYIGYETYREAA
jgi:hypothetical protein